MPFILAQEIRIEEIPTWTIVPFALALVVALVLTVAWVLRGSPGE